MILYIDLDNTLVDFQSGIDRLEPAVRQRYAVRLDEAPGIFALMDPVPGAVEAYAELATLFDTYLLSTAPWHNPSAWSDKLEWVQRHLAPTAWHPAYKRLILSHHKHLIAGDFLIGNQLSNGADKFAGTWLQFGPGGDARFPDWPSMTAHMRQLATGA